MTLRDGVAEGSKRYGTRKNAGQFKVYLEVTTPNFGTRTSYLKDRDGKEAVYATREEADKAALEYNRDRPSGWRGGAEVVENATGRQFDAKKLAEQRPCPRCQTNVKLVDTTSGFCKVCFDAAIGTGELE